MRAGLAVVLSLFCSAAMARASEGENIENPGRMRAICRAETLPGPRQLYVIELPANAYRLSSFDAEEGLLPIDTRRNLRLFRGAVELFASGLEPIAFALPAEEASRVREAQKGGARLRLGFFLGYDAPSARACMVRPAAGVTIVRMDLAYAEIVTSGGDVVARRETARLTDWRNDPERPSGGVEGPHAIVGPAIVPTGFDGWRREIAELAKGQLGEELTRCHAAAVANGSSARGRVSFRASMGASTGAPRQVSVELSTVESAASSCMIDALRTRLKLTAAPGPERNVEVRVPVWLAN